MQWLNGMPFIGKLLKSRTAQDTLKATNQQVQPVTNEYAEQVVAGYNWADDALRGEEVDPLNEQPVIDEIVNLQAVAADPGASYAPSADGMLMFGYKDFSISFHLVGGIGAAAANRTVTVTVECTDDIEVPAGVANRRWIDISQSGYNCRTNALGAASWTCTGNVIVEEKIDWDELNTKRVRIKYDWDADPSVTNGKIVVRARRKAL